MNSKPARIVSMPTWGDPKPPIGISSKSHSGVIISFANLKGGVGKTTTAVNVAAAMAVRHKVLLVDLDPQASASYALGLDPDDFYPSVADVLRKPALSNAAVHHSRIEGLDVIPASSDLVYLSLPGSATETGAYRLATALNPLRNLYDYILIDCPASMSITTLNGLVASDYYVIPTLPHYLSVQSVHVFVDKIRSMRDKYGIRAKRLGIVITQADYRTRSAKEWVREIRFLFRDTFQTEVRYNIRLAEAAQTGLSIFQFDGVARGAHYYWRLGREIESRVQAWQNALLKRTASA